MDLSIYVSFIYTYCTEAPLSAANSASASRRLDCHGLEIYSGPLASTKENLDLIVVVGKVNLCACTVRNPCASTTHTNPLGNSSKNPLYTAIWASVFTQQYITYSAQ